MRIILLLLTFLCASIAHSQCLKADIIFLLDWSGSEDSNRVYIPTAAYDFVNTLQLGPSSVKVGVIPFNSDPLMDYCLHPTYDKETLNSLLFTMLTLQPFGSTSFPSSFELADKYFEQSEAERKEPAMRILIFISDGDEYDDSRDFTLMHSILMKQKGTLIWCISTPNAFKVDGNERRHMQLICSQPYHSFFIEEYYAGLREELLRLNLCP